MSKTKMEIENMFLNEERRLLESDNAPDQDYKLSEKKKNPFRNFKYGKNAKEIN